MKIDMDLERMPGRARQRDKTDVFADESEALDQIAKQVSYSSAPLFSSLFILVLLFV